MIHHYKSLNQGGNKLEITVKRFTLRINYVGNCKKCMDGLVYLANILLVVFH